MVPWSAYFFQTFYHMSILPMLFLVLVFGWIAKPATHEVIPPGFKNFKIAYLSVWSVCVAADWLQGPYVYAFYAKYGFETHQIAQLFVAGFGSSLAFGCIVGSVADKFGRKKMCLAYCVFYIVSCLTKHFYNYWILMFGRITGGIATSMLFSCFECWLVSEHCRRHRFSDGLLSYMFGLMFTMMYAVAIICGLAAQAVVDGFEFRPISDGSMIYVGGYCGPFDLSIICLIVGLVLITVLWDENYGDEDNDLSSMAQKLSESFKHLGTDRNMMLLCLVVSCFEGTMFAFVFNWTPALESKKTPPPHGVIFALFMMSCMIGASVSTIIADHVKPATRLIVNFAVAIVSFSVLAFISTKAFLMTCFGAFLLFEFCCGVYFPSIGVLKSEIVPEHIRGTMYNLYRVPLNGVVVMLLLSKISMVACFTVCAVLLAVALLCVTFLAPPAKDPAGMSLATQATKEA